MTFERAIDLQIKKLDGIYAQYRESCIDPATNTAPSKLEYFDSLSLIAEEIFKLKKAKMIADELEAESTREALLFHKIGEQPEQVKRPEPAIWSKTMW